MLSDNRNDIQIDDDELVIISNPPLHFQLIGSEDICRSLTGSNSNVIETLLHVNDRDVQLHAATNYDKSMLQQNPFKLSQLSGLYAGANLALFIFDMNNNNTLIDIKCALEAYVLENPYVTPILVGVHTDTPKTERLVKQDDIDIASAETKAEAAIVSYDNSWIHLIKTLVNYLKKKQQEELQSLLNDSSNFKPNEKTEKYLAKLKHIWNSKNYLTFEQKLKLILEDYTKADALARLVTNTRKRHHVDDINHIINKYEFTSVSLEEIWLQLCAIKPHNRSGYLATIRYFLEQTVDINREIQGIKNDAEQNPYRSFQASTSKPSKTFVHHAAVATTSSIKAAISFFKPKNKENKSQVSSSGLKYNPSNPG